MFAPKFPVTPYTELRYLTGYELTGTKVDVRYILTDEGMRYDIDSPSKKIQAHILMPKDKICAKVLIDGKEYLYKESIIGKSQYIDFDFESKEKSSIEIIFK